MCFDQPHRCAHVYRRPPYYGMYMSDKFMTSVCMRGPFVHVGELYNYEFWSCCRLCAMNLPRYLRNTRGNLMSRDQICSFTAQVFESHKLNIPTDWRCNP